MTPSQTSVGIYQHSSYIITEMCAIYDVIKPNRVDVSGRSLICLNNGAMNRKQVFTIFLFFIYIKKLLFSVLFKFRRRGSIFPCKMNARVELLLLVGSRRQCRRCYFRFSFFFFSLFRTITHFYLLLFCFMCFPFLMLILHV